jgi:glycosyltransferase involved in cell wall biosynthesis
MEMPEGVSCLCLTYGRPFLLEEAVESFLRQTWTGPKELIILNDHPDQELVFDHHEVVVVNRNTRLRTLGEKRNLSVELARYEYLLPWDDDDVHLPWRIEETMRGLQGRHFFKCPQVWQTNQGVFEDRVQGHDFAYHATAAYSRNIFEQIGGYPCINGGEDQEFEAALRRGRTTSRHWTIVRLPLDRLFYIYRRWHGSYHASGVDDLRDIEPEVHPGRYRLTPHWKADYCNEVSRLIERIRSFRSRTASS